MAKPRTPAKTGQRKATAVDRHIGKRIRETRLVHGMSQEQLADILGITFQQVQKYESGANRITASRLYDVAKALKVPVWHFFDGLETPNGEEATASKKRSSQSAKTRKIIALANQIVEVAQTLEA